MKNINRQAKFIELSKLCNIPDETIGYHLRRLQEHSLINKTYPKIFNENTRMEYVISRMGIKLLNEFEKNIRVYHNMDGIKEQLVTYNI